MRTIVIVAAAAILSTVWEPRAARASVGTRHALIVTLDGYGSGLAGSVNLGRGGTIERIHCLQYPHSLGTFYESVTSSLGFQPSRHEGKIVGTDVERFGCRVGHSHRRSS